MNNGGSKLTYEHYLRLRRLLSLQKPLTKSKWELSFQVVHQTVELFFKDALSASDGVIEEMRNGRIGDLAAIVSFVASKIQLVESITAHLNDLGPSRFAEFRSALGSASGLQSHQFRELELQGGLNEKDVPNVFQAGSPEHKALQVRIARQSLRSAFVELLAAWGLVPKRSENTAAPDEEFVAALRRVYSESQFTILRELAEALFEYDDAFVELRWRHLQIVRRTIDTDNGTGGTAGVAYLENRLKLRFFPEIAKIRAEVARIRAW